MEVPPQSPLDPTVGVRGSFDVAAESTRMPIVFTDASQSSNPVIFANDGFLEMTGYTQDDVRGRALSSLITELANSEIAASILAALSAGDYGTWEMLCRRKDGTPFQASLFFSPACHNSNNSSADFLAFIPLSANYDRIVKQRDQFHALYESAPGFIATAEGPDHRISFANASYKKFVGRSDLEGLTVAEALPDIADQGFIEILDDVYRTGVAYRGTDVPIDITANETGLTTRRYANFVYQPVKDERGEIVGLFCEGYDVTAQRETADNLALVQAELIHLSRINAMGTMAVTLAHELNQPLTAISNYAAGGLRLLAAQNDSDEPLTRALCGIENASQRASDIIRTLRELTKRRPISHTPFQIKPAVEECIRLVRAATLPDVEIIDLTPDDVTVAADRIQIQQVIINLLRNACDAVVDSENRTVTIRAVARDGEQILCVADTGPGVCPSAVQNIFSWCDSSKEGGMGLGLSISRTIVEGHHGRIWLDRSSSSGSEFCFSIPAGP